MSWRRPWTVSGTLLGVHLCRIGKEVLFDTVHTLLLLLPPLSGAIRTAEFRADVARSGMSPELLATDVADYLVRKGVPFREIHRAWDVPSGRARRWAFH